MMTRARAESFARAGERLVPLAAATASAPAELLCELPSSLQRRPPPRTTAHSAPPRPSTSSSPRARPTSSWLVQRHAEPVQCSDRASSYSELLRPCLPGRRLTQACEPAALSNVLPNVRREPLRPPPRAPSSARLSAVSLVPHWLVGRAGTATVERCSASTSSSAPFLLTFSLPLRPQLLLNIVASCTTCFPSRFRLSPPRASSPPSSGNKRPRRRTSAARRTLAMAFTVRSLSLSHSLSLSTRRTYLTLLHLQYPAPSRRTSTSRSSTDSHSPGRRA